MDARDELMLELVLVGIDEGLIRSEADLAWLYAWLQTSGYTSRRTSDDRPAPGARVDDRRRRMGKRTAPAR